MAQQRVHLIRTDVDASRAWTSSMQGLTITKDKSRHLGNGEITTPDQNGAWPTSSPPTGTATCRWRRQRDIAAALQVMARPPHAGCRDA